VTAMVRGEGIRARGCARGRARHVVTRNKNKKLQDTGTLTRPCTIFVGE
tara:strand:+ start:436 stop:582 length:147 start_codon:yes stop_codon:yes gene_type:complete